MVGLAQRIAEYISDKPVLPEGMRESMVTKFAPAMLENYPFVTDFFGFSYTGNTAHDISRKIYFSGSYQKHVLYLLRDYLIKLNKENSIFVDIGANTGTYTLFLSKYVGKIHAFESDELLCNQLETNVKANFLKKVQIHDEDFCELSVCDNEWFAKKRIKNADIIRIDIEGMERRVLELFSDFIRRERPLIVMSVSRQMRENFSGRYDFRSVFPKEYGFLEFDRKSKNKDKKPYLLIKLNYQDRSEDKTVLAYPNEHACRLLG